MKCTRCHEKDKEELLQYPVNRLAENGNIGKRQYYWKPTKCQKEWGIQNKTDFFNETTITEKGNEHDDD